MENNPATIGMEFESPVLSSNQIAAILGIPEDGNRIYRSVSHDASVESRCANLLGSTLYLGNMALLEKTRFSTESSFVRGYEIVTKPLPLYEMRKVIIKTLSSQVKAGEIFSPRASIHVHVGYPNGIIFLKTALALGLYVEPLLYKIAGMGREYRGSINKSAYARPLSSPPVVYTDHSKTGAVLDPEGALDSTGIPSFWEKFGIEIGETSRYVPLRYIGVNIYSIKMRNTLEFRFFNSSYIPKYVEAVAALAQLITGLATRIPLKKARDMDRLSIFDDNTDQDYEGILHTVLSLSRYYQSEFELEDSDIRSLVELINITPQPFFKKELVRSHSNKWILPVSLAKRYGLRMIKLEDAVEPGIIDIHNITKMNTTLTGE